jgi:hypothetical protein
MAHRRTRRQPDRPSSNPQPDGPLVNARAWRWQRMLDNGVYASVSEIGDAENISKSYVSRILRLALLAPDVVEEILAGTTNQGMVLEQLERPLPASWKSSVDACSAHHVPRTTSAFVCGMEVSEQTPSSMAFRGPGPAKCIFYFLVSAIAAPGFGFAGALGTVPVDARAFFLSALGFLASRLLRF